MNTLPVVLRDPTILLIGAGNVARQKASVLLDNGIDFSVIAGEDTGIGCNVRLKKFDTGDLDGFNIVINATGNKEVTKELLEEKKRRFFLLNVVDVPGLCDFYFPALINKGALKVSVSTSGASPLSAKIIRDKIAYFLPDNLKIYIEKQKDLRSRGIIETGKIRKDLKSIFSKAYLIGCGTGDPELLTVKAYSLIKTLDVLLVDHLVSREITDLIPPATEVISVGKQKGAHSKKQDEINDLLLQIAKTGRRVGRLKSGDPFVFGRGAEEAMELATEGIDVEVVAGVSSAVAVPASSMIPVTARGYATGFSVVTAHLAGNRVNTDWCDLLLKEDHTTVVLMGLSRIEAIVKKAAGEFPLPPFWFLERVYGTRRISALS